MMISGTNITLAQLLAFVTVVEEQRFTTAAQKLGLTQSAVSQAVLSLEDAVGVALLSRGRERVVPSAIGLQVLSEAKEALRAVARIRERCASLSGLDQGVFRIGSVASAAAHVLPDRLRVFRTRYPSVEVRLLEGTDAEVCEWVVRGIVDIGLTSRCDAELQGEAIAEDDFMVIVGSDHRLASAEATSIRALADEPFIMSGCGCELAIRALFSDTEKGEPQVAFTVRDLTALFEMVRQGLGVTILPSLSLPADRSRLRVVPLRPARRRTLLAVTKTKPSLVPAAATFLTLLRQEAPS